MKGFVKITATDEGIGVEAKMESVSKLDKVLLLNSFAKGLQMDDQELQQAMLILPLARGLMHDNEDVEVKD